MDNRTIIVLGMHRSGTSALTGSLEAGGVFLGDTNHSSSDNLKGNRESGHIMALHDDLLERNGASWDNPVQNIQWASVHRSLRDLIISSFSQKPLWGFKDPRTLFALNGWLSALPDAQLIGIFRHPFFVAESLFKRNQIAHEKGMDLWLRHNRVMLWHLENTAHFPVIEFSEDQAAFQHQLALLCNLLGLSSESKSFFDPSLRQNEMPDLSSVQNANAAMILYKKLQALRIDRED